MSLNYWPRMLFFCFVLSCWNVAGVFSFSKVTIGDKVRIRRQAEQKMQLLEELKSRQATQAISSQSWDASGNIVINGRIRKSSSFSVISQIKTEAELSIVICRQDDKSQCEKPGLVLCYKANDLFDDDNINREDEYFKHVEEVCGERNGFVVTTETNINGSFFRIDTRFGNTFVYD